MAGLASAPVGGVVTQATRCKVCSVRRRAVCRAVGGPDLCTFASLAVDARLDELQAAAVAELAEGSQVRELPVEVHGQDARDVVGQLLRGAHRILAQRGECPAPRRAHDAF